MQTITITISYYRIIDSPLVRQSLVYGLYLSDTKVRVSNCLLCLNYKQYRFASNLSHLTKTLTKLLCHHKTSIFSSFLLYSYYFSSDNTYIHEKRLYITNQIMNEYISFILICSERVRKRDPRNS